jgi:four helix bundle protein
MGGWFDEAMTNEELRERVMVFALRVLKMARSLPCGSAADVVAKQVMRSGTSVAANYRAALRAKSRADFVNKITIVLEEADETEFWLELAERAEMLPARRLQALRTKAVELVRIFSATRKTARIHQS